MKSRNTSGTFISRKEGLSLLFHLLIGTAALLLIFITTVSHTDALPPPLTDGDNKYAVVVGINSYQNRDVNPLNYAVNDAAAMRELLVSGMGFSSNRVFLFTSDKKGEAEPRLSNITFALGRIKDIMEAGGTFVFFFSGHGITMDGESYLLTSEADPRSRETLDVSSLKVNKVREIIGKMKADKILLIIDACRTDPGSSKGGERNYMSNSFAKDLIIKAGDRQKENLPPVKVTATLFSCNPGESSYEWQDKENGFFTHYLVKGLRGEAADSNGSITLSSLESYLSRQVHESVKMWRGQDQTPWIERSGSNIDLWALVKTAVSKPLEQSPPRGVASWLSQNASYRVSSTWGKCKHLPSLLKGEGELYSVNLPGSKKHAEEFAFHTDLEENPSITIDLGSTFLIGGIEIANRKRQFQERAAGLTVWTSTDMSSWTEVWKAGTVQDTWKFELASPVKARYVKVGLSRRDYLHLAQVRVFGWSQK